MNALPSCMSVYSMHDNLHALQCQKKQRMVANDQEAALAQQEIVEPLPFQKIYTHPEERKFLPPFLPKDPSFSDID